MNVQQLENELWDAADQLRAHSRLTAAEYSMPVLGLIFLRHADNRFKTYLPEIAADLPSQVPAAQREEWIKLGFQGKAAIYLPEAARFERIVSLPQGANAGEAIDAAMDVIEAEYDVLKGALPRGYTAFETDLLADLVKIFDRPAIKAATGEGCRGCVGWRQNARVANHGTVRRCALARCSRARAGKSAASTPAPACRQRATRCSCACVATASCSGTVSAYWRP